MLPTGYEQNEKMEQGRGPGTGSRELTALVVNSEETTGFKLGVDMAGRGCSVTWPLLKPSLPPQTVCD